MPRTLRQWVVNGTLIALMFIALIGGDWLGGRWEYAFPVYLLLVLALAILYRLRLLRRERNGPRSGERLT